MNSAICRTALDALHCKQSAQHFLLGQTCEQKLHRQTPLLNRFYHLRARALHTAVQSAVTAFQTSGCESIQLLLLGGGLDTSFDAHFQHMKVVVVDLPEVLAYRRKHCPPSDSVLVEGDLRDMSKVVGHLSAAGFDWHAPTVVLAECVLCYLHPAAVQATLTALATRLPMGVLIAYDPMLNLSADRADGLAHMLASKFAERGAPLLTVHPDRDHILRQLYQCHWQHNNCLTVCEYMQTILTAADRRIDLQAEPFDEHADLMLLCQRYAISIASTNALAFDGMWQAMLSGRAAEETRRATREIALNARIRVAEARLRVLQAVMPAKMRVEVRLVTAGEEGLLKDLYVKCFAEHMVADSSVNKYIKSAAKKLQQLVEHSSAASHSKLLVAAMGQRLMGCIAIKPAGAAGKQSMEITHFCVDSTSRRTGIGRSLLQHALKECRALGAQQVELSVLEGLVAARALYAKEGFKDMEAVALTPTCTIHHLQLML